MATLIASPAGASPCTMQCSILAIASLILDWTVWASTYIWHGLLERGSQLLLCSILAAALCVCTPGMEGRSYLSSDECWFNILHKPTGSQPTKAKWDTPHTIQRFSWINIWCASTAMDPTKIARPKDNI